MQVLSRKTKSYMVKTAIAWLGGDGGCKALTSCNQRYSAYEQIFLSVLRQFHFLSYVLGHVFEDNLGLICVLLKQANEDEKAALSQPVKDRSAVDDETAIVIEDDSLALPLLTPKLEGASGSKKRPKKPEVGSSISSPSSTPPSLAQRLIPHRKQLTPSDTLPFSPEGPVVFKPLESVKLQQSSELGFTKRKSGRVEAIRQKQLDYS
jgi:hypothetical protein